jgi:hypothetical protein
MMERLSEEAMAILSVAAASVESTVVVFRNAKGTSVQAGMTVMNAPQSPRATAPWLSAVEELESRAFIKCTKNSDILRIFQVTQRGYEISSISKVA